MTELLDKFFLFLGLNEDELSQSSARGMLYVGMIFLAGIATAFLFMTAIGASIFTLLTVVGRLSPANMGWFPG